MNVFLHLHNTRLRFLLCGMCFLTFFLPHRAAAQETPTASAPRYRVAFWNVENLFDTENDTLTNDDEFTPRGANHWSRRRYSTKLTHLCQTLVALAERPDGLGLDPPLLVGLAEVENDRVLRDLCLGTPLRKLGYGFVHFDSPDQRGIDNALLYNTKRFRPFRSQPIGVSDSAVCFFTRDILLVEGVTSAGDSIVLLINHWPSKRGGDEAEAQRLRVADTLRQLMVKEHSKHPDAAVIAMGDLNATTDEAPLTDGMGFGADSVNADGIRILTHRLPKDWGSHKYQGRWDYLDHMFLLAGDSWMVGDMKLMHFDHLLTDEKRNTGVRPRRTNVGMRYEGGLSDHLPLRLRLKRK